MKINAFVAAAVAAVTMFSAASAPFSVYGATASLDDIAVSQEYTTASRDEAAAEMRGHLKNRDTSFTVNAPTDGYPLKEMGSRMMYQACAETGVGTEGDYLRFAIKSFRCTARSSGGMCRLEYDVNYYTTAEEEARLTEEINGIISSLELDGLSDFAKISVLYRYVAENVNYSDDLSDPYVYSAYNAVFDHHAVCQGVTQLLYRLFNDCGISCRVIAGISRDIRGINPDGYHVWLIVRLDDKYYLLDPTWDMKFNGRIYYYFLKGSTDFDSDISVLTHIPQNDNGLSFPDYNSEEFSSEYPVSPTMYPEPGRELGNINGDDRIDAIDASLILMEYARTSGSRLASFTPVQISGADVNRDGSVNAVDASKVLGYYAATSSGRDITLAAYLKSH